MEVNLNLQKYKYCSEKICFFFSVLVAELLKYFYPRYVELHNYPGANSYALKLENWNTMNRKVSQFINS